MVFMNYVVIVLYVAAVVLELYGLKRSSIPDVAKRDGNYYAQSDEEIELKARGHRAVIWGVIVATIASFASLWAPGFAS